MASTEWCCCEFANEEGGKDGNDDDDDDKDEVVGVNNVQLNYSNLRGNIMQNVIKICILL